MVAIEAWGLVLVKERRRSREAVIVPGRLSAVAVLPVTEIHVAHFPLLLCLDPRGARKTDQVGVHHSVVGTSFVVLVSSLF